MLKKRILSAVTAALTGITMLSSLAVNAAEKSLAPWSLYFAPQGEHEDFTKWADAQAQYDSNGYIYISKTEGSYAADCYLLTSENGGLGRFKASNNAQGYKGEYGSPAIGFTAPAAGEYQIDLYAKNFENHGGLNIANAGLGILNQEINAIENIKTIPLYGNNNADEPNKETNETSVVSLEAGDKLTMEFYSTEDAYLRGFRFSYKITDLASGMVYDSQKIGKDIAIPEKQYDSNVFDLGSYNKSQSRDNSMWSIYLSPTLYDDSWSDMSKWVNYPLEENRNADNNGIRIVSGTTQLSIYDSVGDGWFFWRPGGDAESNGFGTAIIGWTAPEAGTYIFDFEGFNFGTNVKGNSTRHRMAYKKAEETVPVFIENFENPGASANIGGRHTTQLSVEAGETIYLLSDANGDGWGDSMDMKYKITNANDASKSWSASDMYRYELNDSPYRLWYTNGGAVDLAGFKAADLLYQDDNHQVITTQTGKWDNPFIQIHSDGIISIVPEKTIENRKGSPVISFDVPADGFYKIDMNMVHDGAGGGAGTFIRLYKASGREKYLGDPIAVTNTLVHNGDKAEILKIVEAKKGDKIYLAAIPHVDGYAFHMSGHYKITKLEKFNFSYKQDEVDIFSAAELKSGSTFTASLDYLDNKAQNLTLVTAVYNAEGTMTAIGLSDPAVSQAGTPTPLTASLTLPEMTAGTTVRTFVVDGINTLVPLTEAKVLK